MATPTDPLAGSTPQNATSPFSTSTPKAGGDGKGKGGPPPKDYEKINAEQIAANRPNQSTPFGSSTWTKDANGNWTQSTQFGGPLAGAAENIGGQLASVTSNPLDLSGAPQLQYGEDARKAAADAAYNQEVSRLDPMWNTRQDAERTRLINQGLDPTSEAFQQEMNNFNRQRNDAYQGALNNSIGLGQSAAGQMFNQSALAHQMGVADILRKRDQPLQELGRLEGFLQMPSFNPATGMVEAARAGDAAAMERWKNEQSGIGDLISGALGLGGSILGGPLGGAAGSGLGKLLDKGKGNSGPTDYSAPGVDLSEPVPF